MVVMPAASAKLMELGLRMSLAAGAMVRSARPPVQVAPKTSSPGAKSVTLAPTERTVPAISPPGENGKGGWLWYLPAIISTSGKFKAEALISINASWSPATGSGTFSSTRLSGGPKALHNTAFKMASPQFVCGSGLFRQGRAPMQGRQALSRSISPDCRALHWCSHHSYLSQPKGSGWGFRFRSPVRPPSTWLADLRLHIASTMRHQQGEVPLKMRPQVG